MYTGDLKPDLEVTCTADTAVDLTAASSVRIIGKRDDTIVFDDTPTLTVDGDTTVAKRLWEAGDTAVAGCIQIEVEATWPGNKKQTFRADGGVDVHLDFDAEALEAADPPPLETVVSDASINAVLVEPGTATRATITAFVDAAAAAAVAGEDVDGQIAAAVANLVGSSPTTLDQLGELADAIGDDPNFAVTVAAQIAALAATIDTAVEDAVEAHTPGIELGSDAVISPFSNSQTTFSAASLITGLARTVVGQGRPVDVEVVIGSFAHSVLNTGILFYWQVDGSRTSDKAFSRIVRSQATTSATLGPGFTMRRRVFLDDGVSYLFEVGMIGLAAGTSSVDATVAKPSQLNITSR